MSFLRSLIDTAQTWFSSHQGHGGFFPKRSRRWGTFGVNKRGTDWFTGDLERNPAWVLFRESNLLFWWFLAVCSLESIDRLMSLLPLSVRFKREDGKSLTLLFYQSVITTGLSHDARPTWAFDNLLLPILHSPAVICLELCSLNKTLHTHPG